MSNKSKGFVMGLTISVCIFIIPQLLFINTTEHFSDTFYERSERDLDDCRRDAEDKQLSGFECTQTYYAAKLAYQSAINTYRPTIYMLLSLICGISIGFGVRMFSLQRQIEELKRKINV